jgi:hypothetical protein
MPLLVSHRSYPEQFFELDENHCVRKPPNKTFAGLLVSLEGKCPGILLNAPNGRFDLLPELASEPGSLPFIEDDSLVQVPLGFRVEDDLLQG